MTIAMHPDDAVRIAQLVASRTPRLAHWREYGRTDAFTYVTIALEPATRTADPERWAAAHGAAAELGISLESEGK